MSSATPKTVYAQLPSTARGHKIVMHGSPDGKTYAYCRNNYVVVRNVEDPADSYTFNDHACNVNVACFSPSGFYMASGDEKGLVKIWDLTQPEHKVKCEFQVLSGPVKDIAWDADSKRLAVCGGGFDLYARTIMWDSGSNVGTIVGHAKMVNSIDFKKTRPFRVATASEDTDSGFYAGPPFKLDHLNHEHDKYVNCVRYSPDGAYYVTADAGGKALVYDGKDGTLKFELGSPAHSAGIYGVSWNQDSKRLITASADKTVKIWDVESQTATTTFTLGDDLDFQQVGCLWLGDHILSASLNGYITYLDEANPATPKKTLKGTSKNVTALCVSDSGSFYSGSADGRVMAWETSGLCEIYNNHHTNQVQDMVIANDNLVSVAMDDTLRITPVAATTMGSAIKLASQPSTVSVVGDTICIGSLNHITFADMSGSIKFEHPITYEGTCASLSPSAKQVAVGSNGKFYIYAVEGDALKETKVIDAPGIHSCVKYSPDGKYVALGNDKRQVLVYDTDTWELFQDRWKNHTAKVTCITWSADSAYVATGSLDTNLIVWYMSAKMKKMVIKEAVPKGSVTKVEWIGADQLIACGYDGCVRTFDVKL
eukprot:m.112508 g.112508  ORF g.112508 m.112508 type:complete len:596 (-) comp28197_c0_seq1:85-1872(-)